MIGAGLGTFLDTIREEERKMKDFPDMEWIKGTCKIGQGANCCRYLTMSANGWCCEKNTDLRALLDRRVAEETITARGDNCEGMMK